LLDPGEARLNKSAIVNIYLDNGNDIFEIQADLKVSQIESANGLLSYNGQANGKYFIYIEPSADFSILTRNPQVYDTGDFGLSATFNFAATLAEDSKISLIPIGGALTESNLYPDERAMEILLSAPVGGEIASKDFFDPGQLMSFQIWAAGSLGMLSWSSYLSFRLLRKPVKGKKSRRSKDQKTS
jgi:hypothetical protein